MGISEAEYLVCQNIKPGSSRIHLFFPLSTAIAESRGNGRNEIVTAVMIGMTIAFCTMV